MDVVAGMTGQVGGAAARALLRAGKTVRACFGTREIAAAWTETVLATLVTRATAAA